MKRPLERLAFLRKARAGRAVIVGFIAAVVLALGGTVSVALPASASTAKLATEASPLQNTALDAALASMPGGTRISAEEASWDGGRLILGVAAPAAADSSPSFVTPAPYYGSPVTNNEQGDQLVCTGGYFCAWGATGWGGTCWVYLESGTLDDYAIEFDWADFSGKYCGSVGTWSWLNDSGDRVWKEQSFSNGLSLGDDFYQLGTPSGTTYCIDPTGGNSSESDVTSGTVRTLGWIYMSDNTSNC
jgi:hypothetical protein